MALLIMRRNEIVAGLLLVDASRDRYRSLPPAAGAMAEEKSTEFVIRCHEMPSSPLSPEI